MHFLVVIWNQESTDYYTRRGALDLSSEEGWHLFRFNRKELMEMAWEEWKRTHHNLSQQQRLQHLNVTWALQQFDFKCCTIQQVTKLWFEISYFETDFADTVNSPLSKLMY